MSCFEDLMQFRDEVARAEKRILRTREGRNRAQVSREEDKNAWKAEL